LDSKIQCYLIGLLVATERCCCFRLALDLVFQGVRSQVCSSVRYHATTPSPDRRRVVPTIYSLKAPGCMLCSISRSLNFSSTLACQHACSAKCHSSSAPTRSRVDSLLAISASSALRSFRLSTRSAREGWWGFALPLSCWGALRGERPLFLRRPCSLMHWGSLFGFLTQGRSASFVFKLLRSRRLACFLTFLGAIFVTA